MLKIFNVTRSNYGKYVCRGTKDTINRWTGKKGIFYAYFTLKVLRSKVHLTNNKFNSIDPIYEYLLFSLLADLLNTILFTKFIIHSDV